MKDLLDRARAVQARAYVPYSGFRVGCALRTVEGTIHVGANVENAAYPQGLCAERSAVAAMIAAGEQHIAEIVVIGSGHAPCSPCGGCRQLLSEFAPPATPLHMVGSDGQQISSTMEALLPLAFGPLALDRGAGAGLEPRVESPTGDGETSRPPEIQSAVAILEARFKDGFPKIALILGSGLGRFADSLDGADAIDYTDLPGFPHPSVAGHAGRLVVGKRDGIPIACLQGRTHVYEGEGTAALATLVRTLVDLGCEILIITNASGSLDGAIEPGSIAIVTDHINMLGTNPLTGANDDRYGPRFPDMSAVYDLEFMRLLDRAAEGLGLTLARGVYLATIGPSFETPAEIRAFRTMGADLVGMSTVPEAILARHAGLRVAGLSIVTNHAAGLAGAPLSHDETLAVASRAAADLDRLLADALKDMARHAP